jgi:hypothetical protein
MQDNIVSMLHDSMLHLAMSVHLFNDTLPVMIGKPMTQISEDTTHNKYGVMGL